MKSEILNFKKLKNYVLQGGATYDFLMNIKLEIFYNVGQILI